MKILFIVTEINSANGICCQAVMRELIKRGHNVYCVTNSEHTSPSDSDGIEYSFVRPRLVYRLYQRANKSRNLLIKSLWQNIATILNKLKLLLSVPTWPLISPSYANRIYKLSQKICENESVDTVIPIYTQIDTVIAAEKIKKQSPRVRYIPYFLDSLSGGYGPKCFSREWAIRRGLIWERKLLKNADKIIVMESSRAHHNEYNSSMRFYGKFLYLDIPLFAPVDFKQNNRKVYSKEINIIFCGTANYPMRNIKYFLDLVSNIKQENILFTFIGASNYRLLTECKLSNVKYIPLVTHDKLNGYYESADILLNLGVTTPSAISGKIFEYMSYGKPIISTYSIDNEACLPYLSKYPVSYLLDEREANIKLSAQKLLKFINDNYQKQIDISVIKNTYVLNRPETFIKTVFNNL